MTASYNLSQLGSHYNQGGTGAVDRTTASKLQESVSVLDFGADPTGVADSTAAFQNAVAYANSISLPVMTGNSNRTGQLKILIPAGQYKITSPIIQSTDFANGITAGLIFEGVGNYLCTINYVPSGSSPLFYNNNKLLFVRFNGIRFYGTSASVDLIDSYSTGGPQDYRFVDCVFDGTWQYGIHLTGTNTNSEWAFEKCAFFGTWTNFLWSETSDQFLNYWFHQCKYWSSSSWLKFTLGGNIKISNCDVSGYAPGSSTYLFNLLGATHAGGVCSFVCHATRFELKNTNAHLIYSEWPQGNILFSGCDTESQSSFVSGLNAATFVFTNVPGPVIKWVNCSLMGTHTYTSGGSGQYGYIPRISYDNCFITQFARPELFLLTTYGVNSGGQPYVNFHNCRGNGATSTYETFDSDQNWAVATRGMTSRKIVRVGAASTNGPTSGSTESVQLPLNSVITKVWLNNPAGSTTNYGSYNFVIRTNEATPTVLGTASGSVLANGYAVTNDLFFICSSDTKRQINVVDLQNITNIGTNYFLIEYIG